MTDIHYSDASIACMMAEPGERLGCSLTAGWSSLLLHASKSAGVCGPFETPPTPDQKIVATIKGHLELECFSGGRWRRAAKSPGSCGMTPGLESDRLRWRALDGRPFEEIHLFIPQTYFLEASEEYRRIGSPSPTKPLRALGFEDPIVVQVARALTGAMETGEPNLYAESAAQFLVRHLLSRQSGWGDQSGRRRRTNGISDRRLARVIDYVEAHYMESLSLAVLAQEAGVSKHHFVYLFRQRVGSTPHHFVIKVRMQKAAVLLGEASFRVTEVAAACGYNSAVHFAAAFRRHYGCSPRAFRREMLSTGSET